jgi:hypothetical protein
MMKKIYLTISAFLIVISLLLIISCTPGSCFEETNAYVKASFYLNSTGKLLAPDSLTIYGEGMDSVKIYTRAPKVTLANIPLNSSVESCSLIFIINGINDTITFSYSSYPHLISKECGYTFYHNIEMPSFTKNIIDTIIMRKSTITTINEENLLIYY